MLEWQASTGIPPHSRSLRRALLHIMPYQGPDAELFVDRVVSLFCRQLDAYTAGPFCVHSGSEDTSPDWGC